MKRFAHPGEGRQEAHGEPTCPAWAPPPTSPPESFSMNHPSVRSHPNMLPIDCTPEKREARQRNGCAPYTAAQTRFLLPPALGKEPSWQRLSFRRSRKQVLPCTRSRSTCFQGCQPQFHHYTSPEIIRGSRLSFRTLSQGSERFHKCQHLLGPPVGEQRKYEVMLWRWGGGEVAGGGVPEPYPVNHSGDGGRSWPLSGPLQGNTQRAPCLSGGCPWSSLNWGNANRPQSQISSLQVGPVHYGLGTHQEK